MTFGQSREQLESIAFVSSASLCLRHNTLHRPYSSPSLQYARLQDSQNVKFSYVSAHSRHVRTSSQHAQAAPQKTHTNFPHTSHSYLGLSRPAAMSSSVSFTAHHRLSPLVARANRLFHQFRRGVHADVTLQFAFQNPWSPREAIRARSSFFFAITSSNGGSNFLNVRFTHRKTA